MRVQQLPWVNHGRIGRSCIMRREGWGMQNKIQARKEVTEREHFCGRWQPRIANTLLLRPIPFFLMFRAEASAGKLLFPPPFCEVESGSDLVLSVHAEGQTTHYFLVGDGMLESSTSSVLVHFFFNFQKNNVDHLHMDHFVCTGRWPRNWPFSVLLDGPSRRLQSCAAYPDIKGHMSAK